MHSIFVALIQSKNTSIQLQIHEMTNNISSTESTMNCCLKANSETHNGILTATKFVGHWNQAANSN